MIRPQAVFLITLYTFIWSANPSPVAADMFPGRATPMELGSLTRQRNDGHPALGGRDGDPWSGLDQMAAENEARGGSMESEWAQINSHLGARINFYLASDRSGVKRYFKILEALRKTLETQTGRRAGASTSGHTSRGALWERLQRPSDLSLLRTNRQYSRLEQPFLAKSSHWFGPALREFKGQWYKLEESLIYNDQWLKSQPEARAELLALMYSLADYMAKYEVLPSDALEGIRLFRPSILSKSVRIYVREMRRSSNHRNLYSVVPTLECLTNNAKLGHFQRSIKALGHEQQIRIAYDSMASTLTALKKEFFRKPGSAPSTLPTMFDRFVDDNVGLSIYQKLRNPDFYQLFRKVFAHIQNPPARMGAENFAGAIEFLFSCYFATLFKGEIELMYLVTRGMGDVDVPFVQRKIEVIDDLFRTFQLNQVGFSHPPDGVDQECNQKIV